MLWLALHFRHLPLEVFTRGVQPNAQLIAITSGIETGATVVAANRPAQARGVCAGMSVSAACALASGLHTIARDSAKEHATLKRIAAWSLQFTSLVSIADSGEILLEIEGSLKLFGGLNKLHQHIARGIAELGFNASIACAPTPLAAQWFARAGVNVRLQHQDALRHALAKLPADLICDNATTRDLLESFGARTLGDCLQLPRDGLARRAGQRLLDQLDRALGARPDPRLPFVAPQTYSAALPLPAPVSQADALLFAARRLLAELCGWLSATGHGVQRPKFEFIHEKQIVTIITLELASASRDLDHLTTLLRERLARTELPCAAIEIAIASGRVTPLASHNLAFLPDSAGQAESASRFVERLNARLGANTICGLTPHADYRPERAWRACQPGAAANAGVEEDAAHSRQASRTLNHQLNRPLTQPLTHPLTRPLWLLTTPKPLRETGETNAAPHDPQDHEGGPLSLLAGPERIEAGWWDGQHVARDYFVARNAAQSLLWIYRERNVAARWYVHGFFS
jgi:protein ImuB